MKLSTERSIDSAYRKSNTRFGARPELDLPLSTVGNAISAANVDVRELMAGNAPARQEVVWDE
jgi:hypothetical protein